MIKIDQMACRIMLLDGLLSSLSQLVVRRILMLGLPTKVVIFHGKILKHLTFEHVTWYLSFGELTARFFVLMSDSWLHVFFFVFTIDLSRLNVKRVFFCKVTNSSNQSILSEDVPASRQLVTMLFLCLYSLITQSQMLKRICVAKLSSAARLKIIEICNDFFFHSDVNYSILLFLRFYSEVSRKIVTNKCDMRKIVKLPNFFSSTIT